MPNRIVTLSTGKKEYSKEKVGGKAYNLLELLKFGFDVPSGFCITTDTFNQFLNYNNITPPKNINRDNLKPTSERYASIRKEILSGNLPENMRLEILQSFKEVLPNKLTAVRSSASCEDGIKNSFAGKFDTFLGVKEENIFSKIKGCWASLYSERVLRYQKNKNISSNGKMGVIVQEIINPYTAGVMFTTATHGNAKGKTLIEAVYGLGESLVSGKVTPDKFIVENSGKVIKDKSSKSEYYTFNKNLKKIIVNTSSEMREQFTLSDSEIYKLHNLGKKVEKSFRSSQDIEWAIKEDNLYLLQTRPITV